MYNSEEIEQIVNFGVFEYDSAKIANILKKDIKEVEKELIQKKSEMSILMQTGRDMSDYVIDLKLFELAKSGDMKALEKLEERKRQRLRKKT